MIAFFSTPLGLAVAVAAVILAIRCFGELLAFAAKAAVVLLVLGAAAYCLGWDPPVFDSGKPETQAAPTQPRSAVPVRWRI